MHKEVASVHCCNVGQFDVVLDDGKDKKRVHLNRSYNGLYVCPMMWRGWTTSRRGRLHGPRVNSLR